jgi:antibiotic biosynthesis monooxygenase (ABM) superfamily enzyme
MADLTGKFKTGKLPKIAKGSVTVAIERVPKAGHEADFEQWCDDMLDAVLDAPGCLGATLLRPGNSQDPYQMVFRFVDVLHLRQWEKSDVRGHLRQHTDSLVASERVTVTAGTDQFFTALGEVDRHRSRVGRFVADVAWVYPVALTFTVWLAPFLAKIDIFWRVLISSALLGATSKYATGPVRRWWRRRRMLPQNLTNL